MIKTFFRNKEDGNKQDSLTIDTENGFNFLASGLECNINWRYGGLIKHSSGSITEMSLSNLHSLDALAKKMNYILTNNSNKDVVPSDEMFFNDTQIKFILKNNGWVEFVKGGK